MFVAGLRKESGCVFYVNARHFESCTARNLKITQHSQRKEREKGKMLKKLMKKEEGFTLEFVDPHYAMEKNRKVTDRPYEMMFEREARVLECLIEEGLLV